MIDNDRIAWEVNNEVRILIIDFSKPIDDLPLLIQKLADLTKHEKNIRVLLDVSDFHIKVEMMLLAVKKLNHLATNLECRAVIGASNYNIKFLNFTNSLFGLQTKFFDDRQKGLDYLAALDAKKDS